MNVTGGGVDEEQSTTTSECFWEVEGYRRTVRRVEDGLHQCGEFMKMLQERADIEKEYAKRLKTWSKKWNENFEKGTEYGTNKSTLKGVLIEADRLADIHLEIKDQLLNDVQTQIKDWKNDNYKKQMVGACKEAKAFEEEFRKAQKPWAKKLEKVIKSKRDYHLACKLERTACNQENNAKNSSEFSLDQVKKLQEKLDKCRKEVDTSRDRYKQSLVELNSGSAKYVEDMTEVFQRTQEFESKRLVFYKKVLYDLHSRLDLTQNKALPEIYAQFKEIVDQSDAAKDLKWFSQVHGVDMPMAWPTYEEYSPELTDIARKKCADLADTGSVMLKRITTNRYNEEFGLPGVEYSPDLSSSISRRGNSRGFVADDNSIRLMSVHGHPQLSSTTIPPPYYNTASSSGPSPEAQHRVSSVTNYAGVSLESTDEWSNKRDSSSTPGRTSLSVIKPTATSSANGGIAVRALFDYKSQEDDELSFRAGEVFLKIKDRDEQGWCTGLKDGRMGLYPDNYVEPQS